MPRTQFLRLCLLVVDGGSDWTTNFYTHEQMRQVHAAIRAVFRLPRGLYNDHLAPSFWKHSLQECGVIGNN